MTISEKLSQIAENEQKVYAAGYAAGQAQGGGEDRYQDGYDAGYQVGEREGFDDGYANGQQAEYDRFWDEYQQNGERVTYQFAFAGLGWTDELFTPKYPLPALESSNYMFAHSSMTDLSHLPRMETQYGCGYMYWNATSLTHIGEIMITKANIDAQGMFLAATALHTIDKFGVQSDTKYTNTFKKCNSLANITFDGVIGNTISFANCPLTNVSVQSIIDHLADLTGKTAKTLTLKADVGAAVTDEQKNAISAKNWTLTY